MRDLLPADAATFDALQSVTQSRALRYGYPRIETPTVEDRMVFVKSVGEASDIVGYEMYEVSQRGGESGLTLRPEGTAAVTRLFLQHGFHKQPLPVRFFYWEQMHRGQRPQKARLREFWQWGLECYGAKEPAADVEMMSFAAGLFRDVGLVDVELRINTLGDAACQQKVKEALAAYFRSRAADLTEESRWRLETNALRILDAKDPRDRAVVAAAPRLAGLLCEEDRAHFAAVTAGLDRLGVRYVVDETMVRGLDYYSRTVWEFHLTDPEFTKSGGIAVAAGGRYDGLVQTMGGPPTPGVGTAGGVDVLILAMTQQGVTMPKAPTPDVYIVSAQPDDAADRTQLADPLREAGFSVGIDYSSKPLDKQLESAVKHGARVAVIRGTPEAAGGNVVVRDLVAKTQRVTRLAAVVTEVGRHVPRRQPPRPFDPMQHEQGAAGEAPFLKES